MDQETRQEFEKVHGRMNRHGERITNLEAGQPFIKDALAEIKRSVSQINSHLSKGIWIILGAFLLTLWKVVSNGGIPGI